MLLNSGAYVFTPTDANNLPAQLAGPQANHIRHWHTGQLEPLVEEVYTVGFIIFSIFDANMHSKTFTSSPWANQVIRLYRSLNLRVSGFVEFITQLGDLPKQTEIISKYLLP